MSCSHRGQTRDGDSSPKRHATAHFRETGHPIARSMDEEEVPA